MIRRDKEMEKYFREHRVRRFQEWGILSPEDDDVVVGGSDLNLGDIQEGDVGGYEGEVWGK